MGRFPRARSSLDRQHFEGKVEGAARRNAPCGEALLSVAFVCRDDELALLTCHVARTPITRVSSTTRRWVGAASGSVHAPSFIPRRPWSQPLMTWPTPAWYAKGCWPGSFVDLRAQPAPSAWRARARDGKADAPKLFPALLDDARGVDGDIVARLDLGARSLLEDFVSRRASSDRHHGHDERRTHSVCRMVWVERPRGARERARGLRR